jgi:acyl carrier protein
LDRSLDDLATDLPFAVTEADATASIAAEVERFIAARSAEGLDAVPRDADLLDGIIDSLGIVELIAFLEERYGIAVDDDEVDPENFCSIEVIAAFVERKGG